MFAIQQGRLQRDQQPYFCVGFNYHPSSTGCQYWQQWDAEGIESDLQRMAQRGFNTVRFFVFWADFEPAPGQYDEARIAQLKTFVAMARRHKLACIPALLTIWMNGQLFDLPWRQGRDLWSDAEMVEREVAYVRRVAEALCDADNILAYDLGDEVIHVDFAAARALSREAVAAWQQRLADAIHTVHRDVLIFQGNEASAIVGNHAFRPDNSQALDLLALHGFPVWSPFAIESIASYKASCYPAFLVQFGRTYGPVLVDELGCYGGDEQTASDYLRATLHSTLANGACGAIVWCWQDFTTTNKPYALRPSERFVGLLDAKGHPKPAMTTFQSFAQRAIRDWSGLRTPPAPIGVYIPEQYNIQDAAYIHAGSSSAPAAFYAYLLLKRAHLPFEFTRGPLERYRLVICPSVQHITFDEQELLARYVAQGGVLYYSSADYLHGFGGEDLFGVRLKDFTLRSEEQAMFSWNGHTYPLNWAEAGADRPQIAVITATTAEVLATYSNGAPAFTRRMYGQGSAYYLNAPLEQQLNAPYRLEATACHALYEELARVAGVERELDCNVPDVEVAALYDDRWRYGFVINHAPHAVQAAVSRYADRAAAPTVECLTLVAKEVHVLTWAAPS